MKHPVPGEFLLQAAAGNWKQTTTVFLPSVIAQADDIVAF
jgi:hypothetical protein